MLQDFLEKRNLKIVKKVSKGFSAEIFLVENQSGKKFALKVERKDSPRKNMLQKEVSNLKLANSKNIGPKLIGFDESANAVLMEFIDGPTFNEWLFEKNPSKKALKKFVDELLRQARVLDGAGS
jgi:predicted Ser/Thr protein kinase